MAVDKKSQHVGNHGGAYTDNDGMRKQFTVIDHDKKLTVQLGQSEKIDYGEFFKQYRKDLINRILHIPASICPFEFEDFTTRGQSQTVITWNEKMLTDSGLDIHKLRDLNVLLENKAELLRIPV